MRLDGEIVGGRLLVFNIDFRRRGVPLPPSRLSAGRHVVSIRLRDTTTTTYRLYKVGLRIGT